MNKRIKKLWLKALRSGDYKQGTGRLQRGDTCCCLGILQLLAHQQGVVTEFDGKRGYLSLEVEEWAGLDGTNPVADDESLGWLNDHGETFLSIADRIEKYL